MEDDISDRSLIHIHVGAKWKHESCCVVTN